MFLEKRVRTRTLFNYRQLRLNARARLAGVYLEPPVLLITGDYGLGMAFGSLQRCKIPFAISTVRPR